MMDAKARDRAVVLCNSTGCWDDSTAHGGIMVRLRDINQAMSDLKTACSEGVDVSEPRERLLGLLAWFAVNHTDLYRTALESLERRLHGIFDFVEENGGIIFGDDPRRTVA